MPAGQSSTPANPLALCCAHKPRGWRQPLSKNREADQGDPVTSDLFPLSFLSSERSEETLQRLLAFILCRGFGMISTAAYYNPHRATAAPQFPSPRKEGLARIERNDVIVLLRCHRGNIGEKPRDIITPKLSICS
jgi:hypothetical protein